MAQLAEPTHLECEWRARVVQEEHTGWVAMGVRQVCLAETLGCQGVVWAAVGRLCLLQLLAWGKSVIVTHADMHIKMITEAQQQAVNALII